ncbi:MAG: hypothetical protein HKN25_13865 [Pyrinomonadaceae bacterium]|nr:hypothetical protein [Pyrinomonadaceae bacterium]
MKIVIVVLFSFFSVFGQSDFGNSIEYKITPVKKSDRTDLSISVKLKPNASEPLTVKLLTGCYGTPNLYKYITLFEGEEGTSVAKSEREIERAVTPNENGEISIKYVISFDPGKMENSAFAPKIHQDYFSVAGCQWLLHFGDDGEKRDVSIEIVDAPEDWNLHSSLGKNAKKIKLRASYRDILASRLGGGGDFHTFYVKNRPVSVFVKGNFDIPKTEIFSAVEKIVRLQRDWFGDYDQPFYQVVINERKSVIAGTAIKNQFVCFVRPDVDKNSLNKILAHEMFHNWLPIKMRIIRPEGDRQVRHEWFFEGFTEYFAKKVLFDAGLLSPEEFARLINSDIHSLADNPYKRIAYQDLLELAKARKFTSTHKKLSYFRGVVIALKWETALRRTGKNLSQFTRDLFKLASKKNGEITEEEFLSFAMDRGVDAKADFEKYILEGKPIRLEPNDLGAGFTSVERSVPSFDPGFSLRESRLTKKISGVEKNSIAFNAGLRNGMEFVSARNAGRFSNSWNAEKPLTVVVRENGAEKKLEYFPRGKPIRILQFQPKK